MLLCAGFFLDSLAASPHRWLDAVSNRSRQDHAGGYVSFFDPMEGAQAYEV